MQNLLIKKGKMSREVDYFLQHWQGRFVAAQKDSSIPVESARAPSLSGPGGASGEAGAS